jgi:hypothetical protein
MENPYKEIIERIINTQSLIIGPLAVELANRVDYLKVAADGKVLEVRGDGKEIVETLVWQYRSLFGRVSVRVCKEAIAPITSEKSVELPASLK